MWKLYGIDVCFFFRCFLKRIGWGLFVRIFIRIFLGRLVMYGRLFWSKDYLVKFDFFVNFSLCFCLFMFVVDGRGVWFRKILGSRSFWVKCMDLLCNYLMIIIFMIVCIWFCFSCSYLLIIIIFVWFRWN